MNLLQILTIVSARAGQELSGTTFNNRKLKDDLTDIYNLRHQDFNSRHAWPWREKTTTLQTIANYTTGTVTVTNGSRTVTGTGTYTSAMIGRFLKLDRESEHYEILDVPTASTLTLKEPYIGDTGGGFTYLIWNRYYNLPPDVPMYANILLWKYPYQSKPIPKSLIGKSYSRGYANASPYEWSWGRINRINNIYTVASAVSTVVNTKTLTGSGTSFIGNVWEGCKITIGANTYNVESVDSDTQITMIQNAIATVSSQTATFETGNRQTIVLSSTPNPVINLNITYPKQTYNLKNDNDTTEIWSGYEHILENVIYGELLDKLTSDKAFNWLKIYEGQINEAWNSICNNETPEEAVMPRTRSTQRHSADEFYV